MLSFPAQIPANSKSSGSPPSRCLASLSLCCKQDATKKTEPWGGLSGSHPASRGWGMLVQYCLQNHVELVGCGVCEVAKLCLKVFIEGSSVDGAEAADYMVHRCRWSHRDIELHDHTCDRIPGLQTLQLISEFHHRVVESPDPQCVHVCAWANQQADVGCACERGLRIWRCWGSVVGLDEN